MLVNRKAFNNDVNDFLVDYEGLENRWNRLNYEEKRAWIIETYGPYPKIFRTTSASVRFRVLHEIFCIQYPQFSVVIQHLL